MRIGPGQHVEIVIDFDWFEDMIDVRRATVYDVDDEKIVLSQTSPPVAAYNVGKRVRVTYVGREADGEARYAINGSLREIIKDYKLPGSETAEAIIMVAEPGEECFNLRRHYRLEPPPDCGIAVYLDGEEVNIVDISVGGLKFNYSITLGLEPKEKLKLELVVDRRIFEVEAEVIRIMPISGRIGKKLEAVAARFISPDAAMKEELSRKIRNIERDLRYKERYSRR